MHYCCELRIICIIYITKEGVELSDLFSAFSQLFFSTGPFGKDRNIWVLLTCLHFLTSPPFSTVHYSQMYTFQLWRSKTKS